LEEFGLPREVGVAPRAETTDREVPVDAHAPRVKVNHPFEPDLSLCRNAITFSGTPITKPHAACGHTNGCDLTTSGVTFGANITFACLVRLVVEAGRSDESMSTFFNEAALFQAASLLRYRWHFAADAEELP
jgi:hypothetical protein